MLIGEVTGNGKGYLDVRTAAGDNVRVHLLKTTLAHLGPKPISPASIRSGARVNISTRARGGYYQANFIYAVGGGGGTPRATEPRVVSRSALRVPVDGEAKKAGNPGGKNPPPAKSACAKNPCAPGC